MSTVLRTLTAGLNSDFISKIQSRVDALMRDVRYLNESRNELLLEIQQAGWSNDRLEVICELNAFYQMVIGPLASSARERTGALGENIPILYGDKIRFDSNRNRKMRSLHRAFMEAISDLPATSDLMSANQAYDLIKTLRTKLQWR
ncbi:MAG: hypothetical protein WCG31_11970 [Deltaproteobacteria bacterium]